MPPITTKKRIRIGQISTRPYSFSPRVVAEPEGPMDGFNLQRNQMMVQKMAASPRPGRIPAMKSFPIDCSVMIP